MFLIWRIVVHGIALACSRFKDTSCSCWYVAYTRFFPERHDLISQPPCLFKLVFTIFYFVG